MVHNFDEACVVMNPLVLVLGQLVTRAENMLTDRMTHRQMDTTLVEYQVLRTVHIKKSTEVQTLNKLCMRGTAN